MIILVFISVLVATTIYWIASFLRRYWVIASVCSKLPTIGPPHWLWGHLNQFSDSVTKAAVEREMIRVKRPKIFSLRLGPFFPLIAVIHPDTAKLLLKSSEPKPVFDTSSGGYRFLKPWLGMGLLLSYGRKWERNRRLLTPAFHFDILKPYIKIYNEVADVFLSSIASKMKSDPVVEIYNLVGLATLDTMLRCAFSYNEGIQTRESHPYVLAVKNLARLVNRRFLNPLFHRGWIYYLTADGRESRKYTNYVHEFAMSLITSRRESLAKDPSQLNKRHLDFLDILITAKDDDGTGLSDEDIRAEVDTFLFEGHDTTASAIAWGTYCLAKFPEEQEKVFQEVKELTDGEDYITWENMNQFRKLSLFIKEVMRYCSPVPGVARHLTKPMEFEGVEIPRGTSVSILIHHMNHHPDVWPDPDVFRPERFDVEESKDRDPYAYVPFSAGPRNCIGQHFALNEQKVMLARLVMRYKVHIVPDFEYIQAHEVVTRAVNGINIRFEKR